MEFLSINEKAQEWNMSKRRIQILCKEERIGGAKMIGNMWVIPQDAKKPLDARKKSPVRSADVNSYSKIRRELKSVLKNLYTQVQAVGIEETFAKKYVLSMLAVSLLKKYLESIDEKAIFELIYTGLSSDRNIPAFLPEIQECADKFVNEYRNEEELDDILSWSYQYFNRIGDKGEYTNTQFFTEGYMTSYLNSRLATYYIRIMSPKLTIAAGYIARLPISKDIYTSIVLEKNAEMCLELKKNFLRKRPNNYEYVDDYLDDLNGDVWKSIVTYLIGNL